MKNDSRMNRAFYLFLVPIVAVIVLLNSGYLQRWFTAVTVYGEDYSAVRYNYYYFSVYHDFLASDDYADSDYNVKSTAGSQQYDENTTWKEHFAEVAEQRLVVAAYYHDLAQKAGWQAPQEVLRPLEEKLAEIDTLCDETGLSEKNYFSAYYGAGMDRERFSSEMKLELEALAYREYLESTWSVDPSDLDSWLAEHPVSDTPLCDLWVAELTAVPARSDGQAGEDELDALAQRADRLAQRLARGEYSLEELSLRYSDVVWGESGHVTEQIPEELPPQMADWSLDPARQVGDSTVLMDRQSGQAWLVVLEGLSGSSAQKQARIQCVAQAMAEREAQAMAAWPMEYHGFGMQLTTN